MRATDGHFSVDSQPSPVKVSDPRGLGQLSRPVLPNWVARTRLTWDDSAGGQGSAPTVFDGNGQHSLTADEK